MLGLLGPFLACGFPQCLNGQPEIFPRLLKRISVTNLRLGRCPGGLCRLEKAKKKKINSKPEMTSAFRCISLTVLDIEDLCQRTRLFFCDTRYRTLDARYLMRCFRELMPASRAPHIRHEESYYEKSVRKMSKSQPDSLSSTNNDMERLSS